MAPTMKRVAGMGIIGMMLGLAACRQPDGSMPVPVDEQPNRVEDIGNDLRNVASRQPEAPTELLDDLRTLDHEEPPLPLVQALAASLSTALDGKSLADADAQQLAGLLFVAASGRDLSRRQIGKVGEDVTELLGRTGASAGDAQRVSAAMTALADAVTRNRKRWYHLGS